MLRLAADPGNVGAADILSHEPSEVGVTRTTCVATMLRAGHAENALPQSATATVNCRIFPGEDVAAVADTLRRVAGLPGLRVETLDQPLPSPASPVMEEVVQALASGVERIHPGTPLIPYMAPYGTDGLHFRRAGIPTYGVMGLFMRDSDRFEHGLNERVPVKAFFDALEFWHAVLTRLAGRPSTD